MENCLNCIFSHKQFYNLMRNEDGTYKHAFDKKWALDENAPIVCQNVNSFHRFREVDDSFTCKNFKGKK